MLIDKYLPDYQFHEKHEITTAAPPEKIYEAILSTDFVKNFVIAALFRIRGISQFTILDLTKVGFKILEEVYPEEIVIGLEGRFWTRNPAMREIDGESFLSPQSRDVARVAWNFFIEEKASGKSVLTTETRISCLNQDVLKKFQRYWFVIRPWSGLIRKHMLKEIRRQAEQNQSNWRS
ncbi:hypothetical protein Sgly_3341 [Syntrophobotulus glycolicus DSM 8271]|uniref:Uncharacterized protein n=1 Tax=Syntrophobotulus glycolicus (strain DSM 8271 / FlGlyR) TaxID=645991 RepID=F0T2W6_SYNGF|nr:hypothetical protein [Syntrophobotulus glycolicus]ADY57603.1 hypothetical protein Sgly_3341 [Syntrophobotulus glycolicus DSM 8271]